MNTGRSFFIAEYLLVIMNSLHWKDKNNTWYVCYARGEHLQTVLLNILRSIVTK
jgi:hypothetical protein